MIPYSNFVYFLILFISLIPAVVIGFLGKTLKWYTLFLSLLSVWFIFENKQTELISVVIYTVYQWILVWINLKLSKRKWVYRISVLLSVLPLFAVKIAPLLPIQSTIGFLGISYLTFKNIQLIMEIQDGVIGKVNVLDYLRFLLFFPTFTSGPIDRYRRFFKDTHRKISTGEYTDLLYQGIHRIFQGFLYKFIIAYWIHKYWLPGEFLLNKQILINTAAAYNQFFHFFCTSLQFRELISHLCYMYGYSLYLFFDFAGYSAFAIGVSCLLGIQTPENFNKPFLSRNIKDFWNRWHMSLSFWFRDYVFMRLVMAITRKKLLKNKLLISSVGYIALFGFMGFWHGLQWNYIVYGLYHAALFIGYDLFDKANRKYRFWGQNVAMRAVSIVLTFHFVCFGFLIFSGRLF